MTAGKVIVAVGATAVAAVGAYYLWRWWQEQHPPACGDYKTEAECIAGGCYWWSDGTCHSYPEPGERIQTRMVVTTPPPSSVSAGQEFPFEGYLEDVNGNRLAGKWVQLFIDDAGRTKATTRIDGSWSYYSIAFGTQGTHKLKVKFEGDDEYKGCLECLSRAGVGV